MTKQERLDALEIEYQQAVKDLEKAGRRLEKYKFFVDQIHRVIAQINTDRANINKGDE
jgi:hypothetical protein